jgi:hypothetical protein
MTNPNTARGRHLVRRMACVWLGHQWTQGTVIQRLGPTPTMRHTIARCARCGRVRRTLESAGQ